MFRAFIAFEIEAFSGLREFSAAINNADGQVKMVDLDNLHVTLKFLGDTREEIVPQIREIMESGVDGIPPFEIKLAGAGAFPNLGRISVIWAGMENTGALETIARRIDEKLAPLGYRREKRKFSPHVTLARVKGGRNKDKLADVVKRYQNTAFGELAVEKIILKKSVLITSGPIYSDVEVVKL